jgi:hypothetical protein
MDDREAIRRAEAILRKHGETPTTITIIRQPTQIEQHICASLQAAIRWANVELGAKSNVRILIHDPDGDVSETDQKVVDAAALVAGAVTTAPLEHRLAQQPLGGFGGEVYLGLQHRLDPGGLGLHHRHRQGDCFRT